MRLIIDILDDVLEGKIVKIHTTKTGLIELDGQRVYITRLTDIPTAIQDDAAWLLYAALRREVSRIKDYLDTPKKGKGRPLYV